MSLTLNPPQVLNPPFGCLISYADWNQLLNFTLQTDGYGVAFQQGVENALPLLQPVALTGDGTDMVVTLGGANKFVLCNGLVCGMPAAITFTVPNNTSGVTRTDKVWILPVLTQVSTVSREVEDLDGNKTVQSIPVVVNALQAAYDAGGLTPPGGNYVEFATIAVPNGAGVITTGEITELFPLMNPQGPQGPTGAAGTNGTNGTNGANGANGTNGHGATTTTSNTTVPAVGSTTSVAVVDGAAFPNGTYVILSDGGSAFYGEVTSGGTTNSLTVTNLAVIGGSSPINAGATLTFSAAPSAISIGSSLPPVALAFSSSNGQNTAITLPPGTYTIIADWVCNLQNGATTATASGSVTGAISPVANQEAENINQQTGLITSSGKLICTSVAGSQNATVTLAFTGGGAGPGHVDGTGLLVITATRTA